MSEDDRYETYEEVPDGYNLVDAPPGELDRYGIPQKPDAIAEPSLFEFWKKLVSRPFFAKRPTFRDIDPPNERIIEPSRGGTLESSLNWSGALVSPPWPKRMFFATARWIAPSVSRPSAQALFTQDPDIPKSLVWVGLDGHRGRLPKISLPQIGTGHWLGGPHPLDDPPPHFAWWAWWRHPPPEKEREKVMWIHNLPIDAYHEVLAGLAVLPSEDVLFFIKNQSTGQFRSFLAKRHKLGDIEPLGSSVEWVVERPTEPTSGKFYPLVAYSPPVDFKDCLAVAADRPCGPGRRLMTLADNGRMIKMREAFGNPYRTFYVSRARRDDSDGSIGITCTFNEPT